MRPISSRWTWWHKKAFPIFWFAFLGLFSLAGLRGVIQKQVPALTLLIPVGLAAFGYILMRWLVFPLVDEVWIQEEELIVRNGDKEDRFPISNIINVDASQFANPERITLTLREPSTFGREIAFSPPTRWWPFSRHPIAQELLRRAHRLDEFEPDERKE
jgi:hypothetical protein